MVPMRPRVPACPILALLLACACGGGPPELTEAARAALAAKASPATWEDLDPERHGSRLRDPRTGIVFVRIPAGTFEMGGGEMPNEQPAHRVQLTKAFLLAETEVTTEQWRRHVTEHAGDPAVPVPSGAADLPMPVSWVDAESFCSRYGYRLPTEAEWERACRGGLERGSEPWRGDEGLVRYAWCHRNADGVRPVRTREPNPFGVFDMLGNVWEWCADAYAAEAYQGHPDPAVDPAGPAAGQGRVLRGGSWFTTPTARVETRSAANPAERSSFYGFRPARTID
jgi:formylglycine-generating enzyme required for sulfatase activity